MISHRWEALEEAVVACTRCPRLVAWREHVARVKKRAYREQEYWGRPIPPFGDRNARLLVVGLAPAAHGANRTGRMFTGDGSGQWLYRALHRAGFANQPQALHRDDGLELRDAYITAVARCAPPGNKPTPEELRNCRPYLHAELDLLPSLRVVVCLGRVAFDNVLATLRERGHAIPRLPFKHGARYELGPGLPVVIASYHPSRQNTNTGLLTEPMLDAVFALARAELER
ncbi:MAG TPA: uracil-DNA glycosylase [Chloroflexota bacterium]